MYMCLYTYIVCTYIVYIYIYIYMTLDPPSNQKNKLKIPTCFW